ncbi:CehA/McbA family metallohydrolase [Candidatus Woesearchaeota archaeon]|nr:CehA/McbA family metallohydrolase [Candidatus Woesearchaeota archaeon]
MVKKEKGFGFGIKLTKSLRKPKKKLSPIKRAAKITAGVFIILMVVVFLTLLISYFIQLNRAGIKGNLHMHTTYSDGHGSYDEMVDEAVRLGLDFIVITDHGYIRKIGEDVLEKCPKETRLFCIIGEEVHPVEGDTLAIGIIEFIPNNLGIEETIEMVHNQGGLAIPAHPNTPGEITHGTLIRIKDKIDAVECYNDGHFDELDYFWLRRFSKRENIPCVFDSDSHHIETLGDAYNVCEIEGDLSKENLFDAIKQGKCKPRIKSFVKYSYYTLSKLCPFIRPFALLAVKIIE